MRVAIIGRPNAGKSTLLNRILGEERLLTGPEAGITRDAIGVDLEWRDRKLKMFDTAGLRKRARVDEKLEKLAGADALRAAKFAEVVVLLIDATAPFEKQDLTLADLIAREGRALVIGVNKWDLVKDRGGKLKELREEAGRLLPQIKGMPIVPVSGATGEGIDALMQAIFAVHLDLEQTHRDFAAQPLAGGGACRDSAARRLRAPHQDPLHHAITRPAALFRHLRQSARTSAGELQTLSDKRHAGEFQSHGRAYPPVDEDHRKSLRVTQIAAHVKHDHLLVPAGFQRPTAVQRFGPTARSGGVNVSVTFPAEAH